MKKNKGMDEEKRKEKGRDKQRTRNFFFKRNENKLEEK
jgi:hypothetical protein